MRTKRPLRDLVFLLGLICLIGLAARLAGSTRAVSHTPPSGAWRIEGMWLGIQDKDSLQVRGKRSLMSLQYGSGPDSDPFYAEKPADFPNVNRYHIRRSRFWSFEQGKGEIALGAGALAEADEKMVGLFGKRLEWGTDRSLNSGDSGDCVRQWLGEPLAVNTCGAHHQGLCEQWTYRDGLTVYLRRPAPEKAPQVGMFLLGTTVPFRDALGSSGWPNCLLVVTRPALGSEPAQAGPPRVQADSPGGEVPGP